MVFARILLLGLVLFGASCKPKVATDAGAVDTFVQNGVTWGYGKIVLEPVAAPGQIMIERLNPEVGLADPAARFNLFRALDAADAADKSPLVYADFAAEDGAGKALIAYAYDLRYQLRRGSKDVLDVWAILKRSGRSAAGKREVWLGSAQFVGDEHLLPLMTAQGLKISQIVHGVRSGFWAIHYAVPPSVSDQQLKKLCAERSNISGRLSNQTIVPAGCRILAPSEDECEGSPLASECRPALPAWASDAPPPNYAAEGLEGIGERTFKVATPGEPASLRFVAQTTPSSDEGNQLLCDQQFFALARTTGDRINPVCHLALATSPVAVDGKLACRVLVQFDDPTTYAEKVCNIVAVFVNEKSRPQVAQVLLP